MAGGGLIYRVKVSLKLNTYLATYLTPVHVCSNAKQDPISNK